MLEVIEIIISVLLLSKSRRNMLRRTHCLVTYSTQVMTDLVQYLPNKLMVLLSLLGNLESLFSLLGIFLTFKLGESKTYFFFFFSLQRRMISYFLSKTNFVISRTMHWFSKRGIRVIPPRLFFLKLFSVLGIPGVSLRSHKFYLT